jgi:hypothetical protein
MYRTNKTYKKAAEFIYRNARPLDLARWQYHFENGSQENVIKALSYYQNTDGGFGHALEADAWNPNSSPIQTWTATEILREVRLNDPKHPMIRGILSYLESGQHFSGTLWYTAVRTNNDAPHAPWWYAESDDTRDENYNPTACLAGFMIRYAEEGSSAYALGSRIVKEAVEQYMENRRQNDMHTLLCYVRLAVYIEAAEFDDVDLAGLKQKLKEDVMKTVTHDTAAWETGYICKPSHFFNTPESDFYESVRNLSDYECQYIVKTQCDDGAWDIPWNWSNYPDAWAISKNWWKSHVAISNMLYLRNFGKLGSKL